MLRLISISLICLGFTAGIFFLSEYFLNLSQNQSLAAGVAIGCILLPSILLKVWRYKPKFSSFKPDPEDPLLIEHVSLSRREINKFVKGAETGKLEAFVKISQEIRGEEKQIWVKVISVENDEIFTTIKVAPKLKIGKAKEVALQIPLNEIEDWTLINHKGEIYGGYSNLAIAKIYERDYGRLPDENIEELNNYLDFEWSQHTIYH